MEVTGIGKLAGTSAGARTKQSAESAADFGRVLGQILDSDSSPGDTRKTQTAGVRRDTSRPAGKKERADSDDQQTPDQTGGSPTADAQAMAGAEQSAAQAAAAGTVAAQSAAPSSAAQTGQTGQAIQAAQTQAAALPAETLTASAPVLEPEAFAANVKAALEKSADASPSPQTDTARIQPAQSLPTAQLEAAQETAAQPAAQKTAAQPAVQETAAQPAVQETAAQPAAKPEKAAAVQPAVTDAAASPSDASAVPEPAATPQDADASAQGGENDAAQTEETARTSQTAEKKKSDAPKTAAAQFSTAVNSAQTARTQDNSEMQAAVNRALDRFDQDFQGVAADAKNLRISLHPKELGTVSISLAAGSGGVTAKIQTSSAEAASLLSAQVQRMIESMEAKGVRVQNVEVVLTQTPQQNTGDSGQSGTQQYQTQNTRLYARQSAGVEIGSALSDYERMTETYSALPEETRRVEYRI